ncbi:LTA synthase family protein [Candidatus Uabimicrobium sp. HlEnr_7]|uniref:LTA synthase family protein n=1 Tax=Candidatus Uabimicrobium helgolandensis TaxID=3095367 RepID=UPI0035565F56
MLFTNFKKNLNLFLLLTIINIFVFTLLRLCFCIYNYENNCSLGDLLYAFYIGFKFDLRLALCLNLPVFIFSLLHKNLDSFSQKYARWWWLLYLVVVNFAVVIIFIIDFGFYDYLGNRLTIVVARFFYNPEISLGMMASSYPTLLIVSGILFVILPLFFGYKILINKISKSQVASISLKKTIIVFTTVLLFCALGLYGKMARYPLFWSDAYFSSNSFVSNTALNPVLLFVESCFREEPDFDIKKIEENYSLMSDYLGVEDKNDMNFVRHVKAKHQNRRPNIVIVFMESFAFHLMGLSNNPLQPTPNFDKLTKESIYFSRFYTPHRNTARSIFTAITGLPDIGAVRSTSRNPMLVKQQTIVNSFDDYNKYYFLGGSASWGNIRGILSNNIKNLQLYEEHMYTSPKFDVWGISDLHLFEEFIKTVKQKSRDKPFITFIQTAGNHSPFLIPKDHRGFVTKNISKKQAKQGGFKHKEAYNSMRFLDHSLGVFLQQIRDPFFDNTIFCFFGDHGKRVPSAGAAHMPKSQHLLNLTHFHVPMVIYAPKIVKPHVYDTVASEVDILPTLASFTSISYINKGLGRNLFDKRFANTRYAFTLNYNTHEIGLIGKEFYFVASINREKECLYDINSSDPLQNIQGSFPEDFTKFQRYCFGLYELTKYLRVTK